MTGLKNRFFSFLLVLLLMPIGHALMVLNEQLLHTDKYLGAIVIGLLGVGLLVWGIKKNYNPTLATVMGFLGGVLVWTGWIEFSFVWVAEKNNVSAYMVNGEVATKPEYLVMLSSLGLLAALVLVYTFSRSACNFFIWIQKRLRMHEDIRTHTNTKKPWAVITLAETIMILWFFYILLLIVYDPDIAGDRHPATYIVGYGSLLWSVYLGTRLFQIQTFDYALRYAIPTVIIFWNFIEVLGRWDTFKEIWVHPMEHWLEVSIFFIVMIGLVLLFLKHPSFSRKQERRTGHPAL